MNFVELVVSRPPKCIEYPLHDQVTLMGATTKESQTIFYASLESTCKATYAASHSSISIGGHPDTNQGPSWTSRSCIFARPLDSSSLV